MMDIQYCAAPHAQNAFHFLPASIRLLHTAAKGRGAGGDYVVNLAFSLLLFLLRLSAKRTTT
jgi:hypothetical protein